MANQPLSVLVFGHVGNTKELLGEGWSVEDQHAWAEDTHSRITIPLPGDVTECFVQFNVWPAVHPEARPSQRLTFTAAGRVLVSFRLTKQETIEVPLPLELTSGKDSLELFLIHPDPLRPSDIRETNDTRRLTIGFRGGTVFRRDAAPNEPAQLGGSSHLGKPKTLTLIVAGAQVAKQIADIVSKMTCLQPGLIVHYLDVRGSREEVVGRVPERVQRIADLFWDEAAIGDVDTKAEIRARLPANCEIQRVPSPRMLALWPFFDKDPRWVPEHGYYGSGRYPFSDRLAAQLANIDLSDSTLFLSYMAMSEKEMPDLDALLAADVASWEALDRQHDVQVGDYIVNNFRQERVMSAPLVPGATLVCHFARQLLGSRTIRALCPSDTVRAELARLTQGYVGWREELPIHPHVARHFGVAYWSPELRYRWFGNLFPFRDYVLNNIRWTPWLP